jgi:hypothetical protein
MTFSVISKCFSLICVWLKFIGSFELQKERAAIVRTSVMGDRSLIFRTCGRHVQCSVSDLSVLTDEVKSNCAVLELDLYILCVEELWELPLF